MFERAFEAIRKNERDYKETLRRYNFRKPRRETSLGASWFNFHFRFRGRVAKR